jgi:hypothetical protein
MSMAAGMMTSDLTAIQAAALHPSRPSFTCTTVAPCCCHHRYGDGNPNELNNNPFNRSPITGEDPRTHGRLLGSTSPDDLHCGEQR